MRKNIILLLALLSISFAYAQSEDENPRPIDSSESYDEGKVLNQMERVNGEGDDSQRQLMQEHPDQSNADQVLPGYDTPEEGYEEDVAW